MLRDLIVKRPNAHCAYFTLGVAFADAGIYKDAVRMWKKVVELAPTSPEAHQRQGEHRGAGAGHPGQVTARAASRGHEDRVVSIHATSRAAASLGSHAVIYLDHNASTPVRPEAAEALRVAVTELLGQPFERAP